jgi:hypothetical protein
MSWTAEKRKCCQQVLSKCGDSFKTVGKAFQVKVVEVEIMPTKHPTLTILLILAELFRGVGDCNCAAGNN